MLQNILYVEIAKLLYRKVVTMFPIIFNLIHHELLQLVFNFNLYKVYEFAKGIICFHFNLFEYFL